MKILPFTCCIVCLLILSCKTEEPSQNKKVWILDNSFDFYEVVQHGYPPIKIDSAVQDVDLMVLSKYHYIFNDWYIDGFLVEQANDTSFTMRPQFSMTIAFKGQIPHERYEQYEIDTSTVSKKIKVYSNRKGDVSDYSKPLKKSKYQNKYLSETHGEFEIFDTLLGIEQVYILRFDDPEMPLNVITKYGESSFFSDYYYNFVWKGYYSSDVFGYVEENDLHLTMKLEDDFRDSVITIHATQK